MRGFIKLRDIDLDTETFVSIRNILRVSRRRVWDGKYEGSWVTIGPNAAGCVCVSESPEQVMELIADAEKE